MQQVASLFELLAMLVMQPRTGVLFALLLIAAINDYRYYRIPNWLTGGGIIFALLLSTVVPFYKGQGFIWALGGMAIGFAAMFPMYALRIMGAGDVKLMAMVGAFLGVTDAVHAVLYSLVAGGAGALIFSLANGTGLRMLANLKSAAYMMMISATAGIRPDLKLPPGQSVGKLPFGVCICAGSAGFVVARQLGYV